MMETCELHRTMEGNLERVRDDIGELYAKTNDHDARLAALAERDRHREDAVEKLEAAVEKGQARLEGLLSAVSTQVSGLAKTIQELQAAPARRLEARWNDIFKTGAAWLVVAAIGFIAAKIFK